MSQDDTPDLAEPPAGKVPPETVALGHAVEPAYPGRTCRWALSRGAGSYHLVPTTTEATRRQ